MELKGVMLRCEELLAQVLETDKTHLKKEKVGAGRWPRRTPAGPARPNACPVHVLIGCCPGCPGCFERTRNPKRPCQPVRGMLVE